VAGVLKAGHGFAVVIAKTPEQATAKPLLRTVLVVVAFQLLPPKL